jgi:Protein of unknown function (DUF3300)
MNKPAKEIPTMGKLLAASLALVLTTLAPPARAQNSDEPFSPDQLDNLTAPIALYPDPLLAQVLVAATFPDQIDDASRFVRDDPNANDVDDQSWDVSVKAVAHYPTVLGMMADKLDWTTALGQAYVSQSTDVMESIQRLRVQARSAGNLDSTPEMEVVDSGNGIELWPAQPEYIYVPVYNPAVVFFSRAPLFFRTRFLIGAWLNYDFDWREHRVFYHGWEGDRGGWIGRSRLHVHINDIYVNRNFRNVVINRPLIDRRVNYGALNRYDDVHRKTNFDKFRTRDRVVPNTPPPARREPVNNKIIDRNINTRDPRLDQFRGHSAGPSPKVEAPPTPAFTPDRGGFDPHQASRRGEGSRAHAAPPPGAAAAAAAATPPPARHRAEDKDKKKH